jgi:hypothetical protein
MLNIQISPVATRKPWAKLFSALIAAFSPIYALSRD